MEQEIKHAGMIVEYSGGRVELVPAKPVPASESRFADRPLKLPPEIREQIERRRRDNTDAA